jgi:hypothetical protein
VELIVSGLAVWALVAVAVGLLLGRSARDADVADLAPAPLSGAPEDAPELDRRVG